MKRPKWGPIGPIRSLVCACPECDGSGSEWPKRRDGKRDRRFLWPTGPCKTCDGTGGEWRSA